MDSFEELSDGSSEDLITISASQPALVAELVDRHPAALALELFAAPLLLSGDLEELPDVGLYGCPRGLSVREILCLGADLAQVMFVHRWLGSLLSHRIDVRHVDGRFVLIAVLADQFVAQRSFTSTSYSLREALGRGGNCDHGSTKVVKDLSRRAEVTF